MTKRRRSGRPRKDGPRTASGRLKKPRDVVDLGSELLQRQRAALAKRDDGSTGDVTLTASALGALFTTAVITQEQHDAGERYARLYASVAGRISPPAIILDDDRAGRAPDDSPEREERRKRDEALFREAANALKAVGSRAKTAVDNVAVYNRRPHFQVSDVVRASDVRDALALGAGLEALAGVFGMRKSARRAA